MRNIGGTSAVVQPDAPQPAVTLLMRNAPVDNSVVIQSGSWHEETRLEPGEERRVQVPIDVQRGAALFTISSSSGFRPSAADPNSHDDRFLGVWVKVLE
jgi:hypothetical protein